MLRYCLLFLCLLCAHTSFSQIPGYQGKRFFAEIGSSFWFNSFNPRANNQGPQRFADDKPREFTLQEHYFLSLNYVLSRKILFSLEYEYSKTGLHIRDNSDVYNHNPDIGAVTPSRLIHGLVDKHNLFYSLYAHKTNFSLSHYFKPTANLAPLGWYVKWGVDVVLAQGVLIDHKVTYGHDPNFNDNKPSTEFTNPLGINSDPLVFMMGIHGGIGTRMIIADRITLNGEVRMTLFPQMLDASGIRAKQADREGRYADRNNINYTSRVHQRVQAHYYLNIVIGIGVLIY